MKKNLQHMDKLLKLIFYWWIFRLMGKDKCLHKNLKYKTQPLKKPDTTF